MRSKVKYFGLSEPTEASGTMKEVLTKILATKSLPESSPQVTNKALIHSLVQPGQTETKSATFSTGTQPSTTTNLDDACYVKEAVSLSYHPSSTSSNLHADDFHKVATISVESPVNHTSRSMPPFLCSTSMNVLRNTSINVNDDSDLTHDDIDDGAENANNGNDSIRTHTATVSPNNSSTSIDILLNTSTTTTSPSSSLTTSSVLSPRRVSLEK